MQYQPIHAIHAHPLSRLSTPLLVAAITCTSGIALPSRAIELPPRQLSDEALNESINSSFFQISPNSERVIYVADQRSNGLFELFSVPISGGDAIRISGDLPGGGDVGATGRTADFQISSDSQGVVYLADGYRDRRHRLSDTGSVVVYLRNQPNRWSVFSTTLRNGRHQCCA